MCGVTPMVIVRMNDADDLLNGEWHGEILVHQAIGYPCRVTPHGQTYNLDTVA